MVVLLADNKGQKIREILTTDDTDLISKLELQVEERYNFKKNGLITA